MSDSQLRLPYDGLNYSQSWWAGVLRELRRVVDMVSVKEAAFAIDAKPTSLSHALAERDRHYVRAEWILPLLLLAPDLGLARALMAPAGLDVERKPHLTAEEKLERLEKTLAEELGPEMRRGLYEKAWRRE